MPFPQSKALTSTRLTLCLNRHVGMSGDWETQEEPKVEFSRGDKVRIVTESVFSTAGQDTAAVPLEGCSSSSGCHRSSRAAKDRVPSRGLHCPTGLPAAAGFPPAPPCSQSSPLDRCPGHSHHRVRWHSKSVALLGWVLTSPYKSQ